ncbi:unnamed protein product [Darwinula stevensoni]|uniref:Uncharacterized protein n=1 Tax=Darwinula stevensoni TaxID=69355 RepID=A0A7R9FQE3_9CRUS|nr:unnamed protein product [Darwinula stevensoni]CAG0899329.1 unnamed protein product [Darwinula stevensoni]
MELHDPDLNPTYKCNIDGAVKYDDNSLSSINEPFKVRATQDTCDLSLNFEPSSAYKGQFSLTLMVKDIKDPVGSNGTMEVTIRMISPADRIEFKFDNTVQEVTDKRNEETITGTEIRHYLPPEYIQEILNQFESKNQVDQSSRSGEWIYLPFTDDALAM